MRAGWLAWPRLSLLFLLPPPQELAASTTALRGLLPALVACGLTTIVAGLLLQFFDLSNVVALFLFTVVLVALRWGSAAGAAAAMIGVVSFDFFFVPPVFSFHPSDVQYLFTLVLVFAVARVTGRLAERLREAAAKAVADECRAREARVRMEGERLRHALLAAVSHDLKTPLTAIRGMAEMLESPGVLPADEHAEVARAIRQQVDALHRQVVNLLDMARMQEHGIHLRREWHALDEIIGTALAGAEASLGRRHVHVRMDANLALVELDASLFERVLANLLDNAAKYTACEGGIEIGAHAEGPDLLVYVQDDGPGLPPDIAPDALFAPFARGLHASAVGGAGLGLALCRRIVEAHGGTMRACSRASGGARFEMRLPRRHPPSIEAESCA
jgi:K+-sensing histidine kinase KdpD